MRAPSSLLAAGAALLALAPAPAGADGVEARAALHLRYTDKRNVPDPDVLFDPSARVFAVGNYLGPGPVQSYPSLLVSAGLDGSFFDGRFRFVLAVDTGEMRSQRFPESRTACLASGSPSGLDLAGSGTCLGALRFPLPVTTYGPSTWTSNGYPFETEARQTLLIREAFAEVRLGRAGFAALRAGRKRITVGDGFVYDDYGLGVEAAVDLGAIGPQWDFGATVFLPTRNFPTEAEVRSPMVAVRADFLPSLFEHAGVFAAYLHDVTGSVPELFRSASVESDVTALQGTAEGSAEYVRSSRRLAATLDVPLQGTSNLYWVGTSGRLVLGEVHNLGWTAALQGGRITLLLPQGPGSAPIEVGFSSLGELLSVRYHLAVVRELRLGAFFLFLSGDLPPAEKARLGLGNQYGGFLGVAPFITATNLFFNGGISESFATRRATAPGVNARGVIAPGLTASWDATAWLGIDGRAAYLFAEEAGPYGGRVYGPELDLNLTFTPLRWMVIGVEADVLFPGDFFPSSRLPITKVVVGVDLLTP